MIIEKKGCLAFAVCGSFCTLENALGAAQALTAPLPLIFATCPSGTSPEKVAAHWPIPM